MIHGSLYRHRLWDQQYSLANEARLILLDLPGHGGSDPLEGEITVPYFATIVAQFIQELGMERVVPVGHSLGGAITLQLALDFPELLQGLILIGTGAKLGVLPAILQGLKTDFKTGIDLAIGHLAFAPGADSKLVELSKTECQSCDPDVGYADFVACNQFDIREKVQTIEVPTLVIVGQEDQMTPVKWSQFLADTIPNAELCVIEQAGHLVMLEQPFKVNQAISAFLKTL
ncbi:MAG: alpha/beta fold hydrolase [Promethearchaeota archaeon]